MAATRKKLPEDVNKLKRYLLFLVGLFVNALGVSLITKASPLSLPGS